MKISGPGSGAPPDAAGDVPEAKQTEGPGFADKLGPGTSVDKAAASGATRAAEAAGSVSDISADLKAGRITPDAALERVIDRVIDRQIGAGAPAAVREQVGAALRQALEDDPLLAEKVRALGRR